MLKQDDASRVVIVGGSLAGLLAAAACCGAGRRIVVLERDHLPEQAQARPGVPQGHQPHVVLHRGMLALERLLPGISAALHDAGAVAIDTGDLAWLAEAGWAPLGVPAYQVLSISRPLLEDVVRRRVRALPGVEIRERARAVSLSRSGGAVPWRVGTADGPPLDADLVVDASGRSSRLSVWLRDGGGPAARVSEVDAHIGYSTRLYAVPANRVLPAGVVLQLGPLTLGGGTALPIEEGNWLVAAVGAGERRPPRDGVGFEAFLQQLHDPALAELTAAGQPLGEVHVHRQTGNRRHHYERARGWPAGLLVLGDALCAFNPVYGQGITVAALQAVAVRDALRRGTGPARLRRLQRRLARVADVPWSIATGQDLRMPGSGGGQSAARLLFGAWAGEVGRLAAHGDARAARAMARVYHLMASPLALLDPALMVASLRSRRRGAGPPNPRPQLLRSP